MLAGSLMEVAHLQISQIRKRALICAVIAFAGTATTTGQAVSQDEGLHNSTKVFSPAAAVSWKHWDDPLELERTWQAAIVRVPTTPGQSERATTRDLEQQTTDIDRKLPTVIYLHGCSGVWYGTHKRIKFFADNGFLVIAPVSLARQVYPRSCNVETHEGGLFRGTTTLRRNDAGYAIEKARQVSIVDDTNIVLAGFSEGGMTTASFEPRNERQHVRARIVEGWTCHTSWSEDRGVNAREDEPVLTLVSKGDPWFQNQWTKGECTPFLNAKNGSKSVVYTKGAQAETHGLLEFEPVQQEVLEFLKSHVDF